MKLDGKAIIITGSTTGIGEAMARRCVAEGARVLLHGRDTQRGRRLADEMGAAVALHLDDIGDPEAPRRIVDAALSAFGQLDGLVNNAALIVRSTVDTTDAALFDQVMACNVRAPLLLVQAALPHLVASQGCVLNIGSVNGYGGESVLLAYSVSKGALLTLSRNLADGLAPRQVRVNHFSVGWVLTENEIRYKIADGQPEDWPQHVSRQFAPAGRMTQPEEVAGAAVYWLSDESRPFSGSVIDLEQYPFLGRNPTKEKED